MTKKRKAPFSRSTGVLAIVIVGGLIVAGGVVVCQMYPSSSAADLIHDAAGRMEESLFSLLIYLWNEVELSMKNVGYVVEMKWLALLRNKRLAETARAMESQALQGISGLIKPREVAILCFRLKEGLRDQLRLVLLSVVDGLELSMEWVRSGFAKLTGNGELFEQVQALLLTAFSFFAEALNRAVTASSLGKVFEWLGMESDMSDVNLSGEHFLAPLVTHQAAIQNIGRGLTAQQFQAIHDVKRFEKRRATIAFATNSIIEDTRTIALESVLNVKMAAVEFIEDRTRQLAEQYVRAFEQALEDYERTSWQAQEEGGSEMLAEITLESQAHFDAAASLKRYLSVHEKVVNEKVMEIPVLGDRISMTHISRDERVSGDHLVGSQLNGESKLSGDHTRPLVSKDESPAADIPDSDLDTGEKSQVRVTIADLMTAERNEASTLEYSSSEKASESELFSGEQANVLTVEFTEVSVVGKSSSSEKAVEGGYVTEDQLNIVAKHTEIDLIDAALKPTDRNEAINEVEQTFAAQVSVDFDNTLLEVELIQAQASKRVGVRNLSEEEVQLQQESRAEAYLRAPVEKTDMKLVEELTAIADKSFEEIEAKQPLADARTRVAAQTGIVAEGFTENQVIEMTQCFEEDCKVILQAVDKKTGTQTEQLDAKSVLKARANVDGAMVFTDLRPTQGESASIHRYDEAVVEVEIQKGSVNVAVEAQRKRTGYLEIEVNADAADAGALTDDDMLESDRIVTAKEILELEQLEQVLLQEEAERLRVEEELRVIAEEEIIWLETDQALAEGVISQKDAVEQSMIDVTKHAKVVADFKSEDRQSSPRDTLLGLPRPILTQIGLFSMTFLVLAALTAYFFVCHRKRGFLTRSPRRHMRWQRLAHVDESEAEEVVLLSDDSSDEEDNTDAAVVKQPKTKVIGQMANVDVEAIELVSSESEEDVEKEKIGANRDNAEEEEDMVKKEDLNAVRSRLIATERARTIIYTSDHSDTSNLDALADGDVASVSLMAPRQETPDTSQRTRQRRRGIRT
ncbi:unnamed protein product [Peronospora farinosa]|uniref:Uncharacterized protein n=1 Tax=Peronospora farinosa TaxID=134698 RepID=A0AAV0U5T7_9STRA|nr:unnamed protein product [Peronospora farinosa]